MPKDRFKTRASYDTTFKYGITEVKGVGKNRTVTEAQIKLMKDLYNLNNLTQWERDFIKSLMRFDNLSQKQLHTLKNIYIKRYR